MSGANETFSKQDFETEDTSQGNDTVDNSYVSDKKESVPVLKDEAPVEQPDDSINPDSDEMLARDDADAIDKNNILEGGRTRHAEPIGSYKEPGDEEGLPGPEDGTSSAS